MSQPFNPKRVLRQISNPLLEEFFERQGHALDVEGDAISNTQVDGMFDAWQRLSDGPRKTIEIVFHDVDEMANEDGVRVIIEEGQYRGEDLSPLLETMDGRNNKAIWTFMNRCDAWDVAVRFVEADCAPFEKVFLCDRVAGTLACSIRGRRGRTQTEDLQEQPPRCHAHRR